MKDLRSFPLGLVILLAAIVLAGALRYQRARAQRPARLGPEWTLTPCQTDRPTAALARQIEEPRPLPEVAASPLGMPIDLSSLEVPPDAGPWNRSREAGGINVRQERAALYQLEAEVERMASPPRLFARQAFNDLDGAVVRTPALPIWSLSEDFSDPVTGRLGSQREFLAGQTRGTRLDRRF